MSNPPAHARYQVVESRRGGHVPSARRKPIPVPRWTHSARKIEPAVNHPHLKGRNYNETNPFPPQPPDFALIFPYPQLGNVFIFESRAAANYHGLQARLERRLVNGLTFLVSYTFQKTLTDLDSSSVGVAFGAGAGLQTIKNIRGNYGPAVFDRPHRLIGSSLYELLFFRNRKVLLGKVAGGWQIGAIATFQDGPSLTPSSYE